MLDRRRLAEAWFKWNLIKWQIELGINPVTEIKTDRLDGEIEKLLPSIREHFTRKWSGWSHSSCKTGTIDMMSVEQLLEIVNLIGINENLVLNNFCKLLS